MPNSQEWRDAVNRTFSKIYGESFSKYQCDPFITNDAMKDLYRDSSGNLHGNETIIELYLFTCTDCGTEIYVDRDSIVNAYTCPECGKHDKRGLSPRELEP